MTALSTFDETIKDIVGDDRYLRAEADMLGYLEDWRGRYRGEARGVALPKSTEEVSAIVRACGRHGVSIVPQSGNTGLVGGAVPMDGERAIVLNLSRMNRIRAMDVTDDAATVEAGVILATLREEAEKLGRCFPVNLGSVGSCQIGGLISTNAGGTEALRHGVMRNQVLGLEVVLPDGRVWNGLRSLRKDNSGYDLKQMFIGAEGTLGVVTAAVVKLSPMARRSATAMVAFPNVEAALSLLRALRERLGNRIEGFELMSGNQLDIVLRHAKECSSPIDPAGLDWFGMIEIADTLEDWSPSGALEGILAEFLESGEVLDAVIAANLAQAERIWALRHNISESNKREGFTISNDTSVPISRIPDFLSSVDASLRARFPALTVTHCGHIGDGNVHVIGVFPHGACREDEKETLAGEVNRVVHMESLAQGGSIAAEHGVGRMHVRRLMETKDETALDLMRIVKAGLDPQGLMNPGKIMG